MTTAAAESDLPSGWGRVRVRDALTLRNGRAFKASEWSTTGRPIIRIQNLKSPDATFNCYDGDLPDQFRARNGDLLFAWSGTPGTSFGAHIWEGADAWVNQHIFRVDFPDALFNSEFLRLALNHNVGDYIAQAQGGVGLAHITKKKLDASTLLVPPLSEQLRIVERLNEVDAHRLACTKHLNRSRALTENVRRSVLHAACSGRLTEDWRAVTPQGGINDWLAEPPRARTHPTSLPTSTESVGLTSEERRELLPHSWRLVRLGEIFDVATGATPLRSNKAYYDDGTVPWVTSGAVNYRAVTQASAYITERAIAETNARVFPAGTMLVAMYGEGQARGRVAELKIDAATNQAVAAIQFNKRNVALRPYVRLFFEEGYQRMRALSFGGVQPNLSLGVVRDTLIPMPPLDEQHEVVRRVDELLDGLDAIIRRLERSTRLLGQTGAASLGKAIRGELVVRERSTALDGPRVHGAEA